MREIHVMAPSVRKALDDMQVMARMELIEEAVGRLVKFETDLASLLMANQANGVLFSGTARTDAVVGGWQMTFQVPYARVRIYSLAVGTAIYSVLNYDPGVSVAGALPAVTPGNAVAGRFDVGFNANSGPIDIDMAGQMLYVQTPAASTTFGITVYSKPSR